MKIKTIHIKMILSMTSGINLKNTSFYKREKGKEFKRKIQNSVQLFLLLLSRRRRNT